MPKTTRFYYLDLSDKSFSLILFFEPCFKSIWRLVARLHSVLRAEMYRDYKVVSYFREGKRSGA